LRTLIKAGLAAICLIALAVAQTPWVLTFSEEFDGRELDLKKWTPHDLANGKAYPIDAAQVSGGMLHLAAKPGFITTYSKFAQTYGRFEILCRVTGPTDVRVSFRLLPLPSGELPAIEFSYSAGKYTFENRWGTPQTQRSYGDTIPGPDLSTGFHTIAIEWDADHISWLVDGKERLHSADGIPHQPLYLTLEAEGNNASFDVDAIRAYQRR
jgi:beta-glucanase (GH16 family)